MVLLRGIELDTKGPLHIEVTVVLEDVYDRNRWYVDVPLTHTTFKPGERVRVIVEGVDPR